MRIGVLCLAVAICGPKGTAPTPDRVARKLFGTTVNPSAALAPSTGTSKTANFGVLRIANADGVELARIEGATVTVTETTAAGVTQCKAVLAGDWNFTATLEPARQYNGRGHQLFKIEIQNAAGGTTDLRDEIEKTTPDASCKLMSRFTREHKTDRNCINDAARITLSIAEEWPYAQCGK